MDAARAALSDISSGQDVAVAAAAACLLLGGLSVLRTALRLAYAVFAGVLRPGKKVSKYGTWAVVTGATDGIGKAMSVELARKGMSVVLVSRTQSKLDDVAAEVRERCPKVEVETLQVDFATFGDAASLAKVHACLDAKDVGVLVNNVGRSYDHPMYYEELPEDEVRLLNQLNVTSVAHMTHIVLPGMKERRRGAIVNISSTASQFDNPMLVGYSGTKAYAELFSQSLQAELAACRGDFSVQCMVPFFVTTKLAKIKRSSLFTPTPERFARSAVANIGYETLSCPYPPHQLQLWLLKEALPSFLTRYVVQITHADLRKRALRKKARKAQKGE